MRGVRMLWLTAGLLLACTAVAAAATVTATGQGATERAALREAMRSAIEQEVGVLVDSHTYVKNYQLIHDDIYTHSEGYVSRYEVLEKSFASGIHRVTIRAEVSESLQSDLMTKLQKQALIRENLLDPRIGVVISDSQDRPAYHGVAAAVENEIVTALRENGFSRLVDLGQVEASVKKRIATAVFAGDTEGAAMLKNSFPVDYLVTGLVDVTDTPGAFGWGESASAGTEAILTIRFVNVNSGEIAYAGTFRGRSQRTGSRAVTVAVQKASRAMVRALADGALQKAADPGQHVMLQVTAGVLGNLGEAYDFLSRLSGVRQVYPRQQQGESQAFDVDYDGTAFDLARALEDAGIAVREMSAEYLRI